MRICGDFTKLHKQLETLRDLPPEKQIKFVKKKQQKTKNNFFLVFLMN